MIMTGKAICLVDTYPELRVLIAERDVQKKKMLEEVEEMEKRAKAEAKCWWGKFEDALQQRSLLPDDWDRNDKKNNIHIDSNAGIVSIERDWKPSNEKSLERFLETLASISK
jgi:hypothetical protein